MGSVSKAGKNFKKDWAGQYEWSPKLANAPTRDIDYRVMNIRQS